VCESMSEYELKVITPDLVDRAYEFMWENFFPDEPFCRSVGVRRGFMVDAYFKDVLKNGHSNAALTADGVLVGVRGGEVISASDKFGKFMGTGLIKKAFDACMSIDDPKALDAAEKFLDYNVYKLMETTGAKKVYKGLCVCTAKEARGKGLGTKLIEESIAIATAAGCEYMYLMAASNNSIKIFDKLGFETLSELVYSEFVDAQGKPKLKDTREHVKAQVRLKKL